MDKTINFKITFIGIGAPKCATTWISECLREHPDVYMSIRKETHFFTDNYSKGMQWYASNFTEAQKYLAVGEFSTSYLYESSIAKEINYLFGNIKILVAIRNPVDRFLSHYKYYLRSGQLPPEYKLLDKNNFDSAVKKFPDLIRDGYYFKYLKPYLDTFGKNNIYILIQEDIENNPGIEVKNLYKFLEVNTEFIPTIVNKKVSKSIVPKLFWLEKSRQKVFWMLMQFELPQIINFIKKIGLSELYRKFNSESREQMSIEEDIFYTVSSLYRKDISELSCFIGRNLTEEWKL